LAERLCENLGIKMWENRIQEIYEEFMRQHSMAFDWADLSKTGRASVQATLRTVQGLAASHQFNSGIVATGNHTEIVLGWASFHDIGSIGVHAILGDMTKMELYQFARYLNAFYQKEVIPKVLYDGSFKPAAELPDAMEDPINYPLQSGICALLIRERLSKNDLINAFMIGDKRILSEDLFPDQSFLWNHSSTEWEKEVDFAISKMKRSVYKAAQGAPIVIISPRSRGFSNRETLINEYTGRI
jgi:NAD+ synthase (glutamine-hydrolysing)